MWTNKIGAVKSTASRGNLSYYECVGASGNHAYIIYCCLLLLAITRENHWEILILYDNISPPKMKNVVKNTPLHGWVILTVHVKKIE